MIATPEEDGSLSDGVPVTSTSSGIGKPVGSGQESEEEEEEEEEEEDKLRQTRSGEREVRIGTRPCHHREAHQRIWRC